jgi:hypothetical protein
LYLYLYFSLIAHGVVVDAPYDVAGSRDTQIEDFPALIAHQAKRASDRFPGHQRLKIT